MTPGAASQRITARAIGVGLLHALAVGSVFAVLPGTGRLVTSSRGS
ncbi:MAG TPA: hypothetical protein VFZ70_12705 [Euzebyales bacterium]